ncbi:MAG: tryptophan--tRNA ligase [Myxococcales bacterium]|nr:tryptophan--tRNA ligase [Myxococcales bacterium]HIK85364.1 tryptophan--tRNA ligase [Myxococcales bacterium]
MSSPSESKTDKLPKRALRVLSGTKPTGEHLHLGNYFGALRQFVALQQEHDVALYFIADYHSMTTVRNAATRRQNTFAVALDYLAAGLDPDRAILFRQSDLPEVTELTWILTSITPMGMLERAHAYKAAMDKGEDIEHGLFTYPVLMAADILLYGSHLVPVGRDQKQHIEMARDMAQRFNRLYKTDALVLPEPFILDDTATVPGTDGRKMSKSYDNTISMFAAKGRLKKSVMGIVTDSAPVEDPKDTSQAVFELWSLFATEVEREEMFARATAGGLGYGEVKKDLLARVMDYFEPMRARRTALEGKSDEIESILRSGAERARALATPVMEACRSAAGLGPPPSV